ncbi:MAG: S8 family peptidase [Eubacteriales bacterium]|nr:S8 family peptidase [Eubacteriales bacterium]
MSILLDYVPGEEEREGEWYCYQTIDGALGVYYVRIDRALPLSPANYLYRYIPQLYGLEGFRAAGGREFDPEPLEQAGILAQQRPPLELTGRGVIFACIDTGISYEDPVFRFSDGSSRILAIWDQTDQSGRTPEGIAYGSEYMRDQINEALSSAEPHRIVPMTDEIGHGTALASAAAGSRLEEGLAFCGAAPEADLVVVKLRPAKRYLRDYFQVAPDVPAYSTDDILLAVRYVQRFVTPLYRPAVICLGLGTSLGSHSGGSLAVEYLQEAASRVSQVLVTGGGNEGNSAGHFRSLLTEQAQPVELRVGEQVRGFTAELWGMRPAVFRIGVRSPGGEAIPETDFRLGASVDYTFVYEKTRVRIDYMRNENNTADELIQLRFDRPTPGVWTLTVRGLRTAGSVFDLWLMPRQFLSGEAYFLAPDPDVTLTMPSYTEDAVTASAYDSRSGSFFYRSGRGFSRTGAVKPDLAAPGVGISTADGPYSGAAMAAALTAGAAAQLMQWCVVEGNYRRISGRSIRGFLSRGAREEPQEEYPSRRWGYGRLDMRRTFDEIAGNYPE